MDRRGAEGFRDREAGPGPSRLNQNGTREIIRRVTGGDESYATLLTSLIADRPDYGESDYRALFKTIDLETAANVNDYIKILDVISRYEGFNPREVINTLYEKHRELSRQIREGSRQVTEDEFQVRVMGEDKVLKFSNNMEFYDEMRFICLMFITRGAAFDKIMGKSHESMKYCMGLMKAKYNINTIKRASGTTLPANVITIPRIAASFPAITVGLFTNGVGRLVFEPSDIFGDVNVSKALLSPMSGSVLPHTPDAPIAVITAIAVKTDEVLHQTTPKTKLSNLYTYVMASYNSQAVTEPVKAMHCVKWGLGSMANGNFVYADSVLRLREVAINYIMRSRSQDDDLQLIIRKLT